MNDLINDLIAAAGRIEQSLLRMDKGHYAAARKSLRVALGILNKRIEEMREPMPLSLEKDLWNE